MYQTTPCHSDCEGPMANQQQKQDILDLISSPYWAMLSPRQQQNWQNQLTEISGRTNEIDLTCSTQPMQSAIDWQS